MCYKLLSCCNISDYTHYSKNKLYLWFSKEVDIDSTEDGLPSVFQLLGFVSVFFYYFNSNVFCSLNVSSIILLLLCSLNNVYLELSFIMTHHH